MRAWTLVQRTFEPFLFTRVRAAWGGAQWGEESGGKGEGEMDAGAAVFVGVIRIISSLHAAVANHSG